VPRTDGIKKELHHEHQQLEGHDGRCSGERWLVRFLDPLCHATRRRRENLELTVASIYEFWLVCTFTGWFGEEMWASPPLPFKQLDMKLTFKAKTLTFADFRWLLERVFRLQRGSETLHCAVVRPSSLQDDSGPNKFVLDTLAQKVHLYLADYDLSALLDDAAATEHLTWRVLNKAVPTCEEGLETHEAYLQLCFDCVRLTYIDEASYLAAPIRSSCSQKG
jgi:hypothetical protein